MDSEQAWWEGLPDEYLNDDSDAFWWEGLPELGVAEDEEPLPGAGRAFVRVIGGGLTGPGPMIG